MIEGVKTAVVWCPGPSLAEAPQRPRSLDTIQIAVNRAVLVRSADYWVCRDARTAIGAIGEGDQMRLCGRVGRIVCGPIQRRKLCEAVGRAARIGHVDTRDLTFAGDPGPGKPPRWRAFSATTAAALAARLGCREIVIWGMDLAGERDFDGYSDARQHRSDARWQKERQIWRGLIEVLAERGVAMLAGPAAAAEASEAVAAAEEARA